MVNVAEGKNIGTMRTGAALEMTWGEERSLHYGRDDRVRDHEAQRDERSLHCVSAKRAGGAEVVVYFLTVVHAEMMPLSYFIVEVKRRGCPSIRKDKIVLPDEVCPTCRHSP